MLVSKTFGNISVTFSVSSGKVLFEVNGSHHYQKVDNKVAITRWLLKCFKQAQASNPYLYCFPFNEDGRGDYRNSIYQRVGFAPTSEGILEWGTKPIPVEVELTDYYHRREGKLEVLATIGEWHTSIPLPFRYRGGSLIVTDDVGDWHKAILIPS